MSVWSVSQRLLPILSGGVTWCLLDQPKSFLPMSVVLPVSIMKTLLISVWIELVCLVCQCLLVSSTNVCLKCFQTSFANLSEGITWCLPGSAQCLSSQYLSDRVWSVSIRAGSHLSLSANVCYEEPADVCQDWTRVSSCWCLSSKLSQCLARSVSQCLLPIYLKGSLDVFQDQPNVFLPVSV